MGFIKNWTLKKTFSQFLTKEGLDKLESGELGQSSNVLKESNLEFVFISVNGISAQEISNRMGLIADLALEHNGFVDSMVSSIVLVIYGIFPTQPGKSRHTLIEALSNKFGSEIKVVHGKTVGHYGNLGGPQRMSFSFIILEFLDLITQLAAIDFGVIKEINKAG